jgi:hypothetical protein
MITKGGFQTAAAAEEMVSIAENAGAPTDGVAPVKQVETATIVETVPGTLTAGNATIVVTAAGMTNSPKTVSVAVALNDTASQVATKVRAALAADPDVSAFFDISGATDKVILTKKVAAANDGTLNMSSADGTSAGIATTASSANTTAGVAAVAGTGVGSPKGMLLIDNVTPMLYQNSGSSTVPVWSKVGAQS